MKWLSSFDELLYEVISWLVFFPLTLWRVCRRPMAMMDYADRQLRLPEPEQYADALSPPLFLALSLGLAHLCATAFGEADQLVANRHGLAGLIIDDTSALVLRMVVFALFPLMMAVRFVRSRGLVLDRKTLRLPFYAHCYPASVFALGRSLGTNLARLPDWRLRMGGLVVVLAALAYYAIVETRWFAVQGKVALWRAFGSVLRALAEGFALLLLAGVMLAG